jgi:hypothetical protein
MPLNSRECFSNREKQAGHETLFPYPRHPSSGNYSLIMLQQFSVKNQMKKQFSWQGKHSKSSRPSELSN